MIHGIGTDFMLAERITSLGENDKMIAAVFTEKERLQAGSGRNPMMYYASHFSGKEAVFKAIGRSPDTVRLNEIEIMNDEYGKPHVFLYGNLKAYAAQEHISEIHLSLSWDDVYCQAFAVAVKG